MDKKAKLGWLTGRFQPRHKGHEHLIRTAAGLCDHLLILIGSVNQPRSIKNPWTYHERKTSMLDWLRNEGIFNVTVYPVNDYRYGNSQWMSDINSIISEVQGDEITDADTYLFGFDKKGNDYLKWFPQYRFQHIETVFHKSASDLRTEMLIAAKAAGSYYPMLPQTVVDDYDYYLKEEERFSSYPFLETLNFNCGDAILECAGHIPLIKRKFSPGRDCWALPGGFRNVRKTEKNETVDVEWIDTAFRELIEETNVRVPEKVLRANVVQTKLYSNVNRSFGIPRNTLAVHIRIRPDEVGEYSKLPRIAPRDDAMEAKWVLMNEAVNNYDLYDDHKDILIDLCGVMPIPAHKNPRFL